MKRAALLISFLVVAMLLFPAASGGAEQVGSIDKPGSQVGWLTIISSPSGAPVYIDGTVVGITPINSRELKSGSHTIKITLTGGYELHCHKGGPGRCAVWH